MTRLFIGFILAIAASVAQESVPPDKFGAGPVAARSEAKSRRERSTFAMPGELVFPFIVDGGGFRTLITLVNLEDYSLDIDVYFVGQDGNDLSLPLTGIGRTSKVSLRIPPAGSRTLETQGLAPNLQVAWGLVFSGNIEDTFYGLTQIQAGSGSSVTNTFLPPSSLLHTRFFLAADARNSFDTSILLVNANENSTSVVVKLRSNNGETLAQRRMSLPAFQAQNYDLSRIFTELRGTEAVFEFEASDWGIAAVGLRWAPNGAFSPIPVIANVDWR